MDAPLVQTFWLPRAGSSLAACEDAFAVRPGWPFAAAVADGATESIFSGAWARHLVQRFCQELPATPERLRQRIVAWRACWQPGAPQAALPWYLAAKLEEGAHAALLGLVVQSDGTWRAVAVGDAVLLHLRQGCLRQAWPLEDPAGFHHRPVLISSRGDAALPAVEGMAGRWRAGDAFILATDALGAWLLATNPARLLQLAPEEWAVHITAARRRRDLRNDDVAAVVVHCPR
ncbi:protein phosphatase 2C domain-containing protein [Rhodothermus profundi]|uniref:Protein phosphatase 2C n=1 Tax=Rhodothermus profundi TaxID=633813 RepID=A0A1M6QED4_9BACT|nr:protein phosphatase 2C domain-containing protein [Rhodothermus profundi]SHK18612.1 Protein phosphatase 2C [Rhodothermus profundi]